MNAPRHRLLAVGALRAFEAVARRSNFSAAAVELHLTQPAVSRQIRGLEDEIGAVLFLRGTRHVELTGAGMALLRAVEPLLNELDGTVRQLRHAAQRRQPVGVTTFASFASMWLLPRLQAFQTAHPDIDIRLSANDTLADLDDPELDLALRYCRADQAPAGSDPLFEEVLTPVASPGLLASTRLSEPAGLRQQTLLEEDHHSGSSQFLTWRHWLGLHAPGLEPRGWLYLNFAYQQTQAALAGQGVTLARVPLVLEAIERGDLVEPFGPECRVRSHYGYWLLRGAARRERPALAAFEVWLLEQAAATRAVLARLEVPSSLR